MSTRTKLLLIRLDKIGDLVCTLPVDKVFPDTQYEILWVVQKGLGNLVKSGETNRSFVELDKTDPSAAQKEFLKVVLNFRPDAAISFQAPWWINFELWRNKIPQRYGVLSQWHSFLFLNHGLRQKRSEARQHEYLYNLDLVREFWQKNNPADLWNESSRDFYFKIRKPIKNDIRLLGLNKPYIVIHPGMAGSALNWPQEKYIEFIRDYSVKNPDHQIALTGTLADEPYLTEIKKVLPKFPTVVNLQNKLNFESLLEVLYFAEKIIAPSTGVAHLAAALDKKVLCLFSPIQVHRPTRWSPRGPNVQTFIPDVQCPSKFNCLKEKCSHFDSKNNSDCMRLIQINELIGN